MDEALNEVQLVHKLYHPMIIQHFEVIDEPLHMMVVQELCMGGTLAETMQNGPYHEAEVAQFTRGFLSCLNYLLSRGIVHRNFNPYNIIFSQSNAYTNPQRSKRLGLPKLIDFGLAANLNKPKVEWQKLELSLGRQQPPVFK
jgi:eukaryotic-like serine/threonine-protein kinase